MTRLNRDIQPIECRLFSVDKTGKSYSVCSFRLPNDEFIVIQGKLPKTKGLHVVVEADRIGSWCGVPKYESFGWSFCQPSNEEEYLSFFEEIEVGAYVGKKIYDTFGDSTWNIIRNDPWQIRHASIGAKMTTELVQRVREVFYEDEIRTICKNVKASLTERNLKEYIDKYWIDPVGFLKSDPYVLCDFGLPFRKADAVAESLGITANHPVRVRAYIDYVARKSMERGNTCCPKEEFINAMLNDADLTEADCDAGLADAIAAKAVVVEDDMVFTAESYDEETSLARHLNGIKEVMGSYPNRDAFSRLVDEYEKAENITLAKQQREAVINVFMHGVTVVTGGPGTGKTTVIKAMLYIAGHYRTSSLLLAPTGKAARRMSEATGCRASTVHKAIGYMGDDKPCMEDKLCYGLIVVDEASMLDQNIAEKLFARIGNGTHLVLVGDPEQLPSIGCGNVLHDLIDSGAVPVTRLEVTYRQAEDNPIVSNAIAIKEGRTDLVWDERFRFIELDDSEEILDEGVRLYCEYAAEKGIGNVVLLNPQRNNTEVSVDKFNSRIKMQLNPDRGCWYTITRNGTKFNVNDKVMNLRNTATVQNGEVGIIRDIYKDGTGKRVIINFNGIDETFTDDDLRYMDLGYCSTVHKSQGSEYDTVIIIMTEEHSALLNSSMLMTSVTRAKQNVILIGQRSALEKAIRTSPSERYTLLKKHLNTCW